MPAGADGAEFLGRGQTEFRVTQALVMFFLLPIQKKKKKATIPPHKAVYPPGLSPAVSPGLKVPTETPSNTSTVGPQLPVSSSVPFLICHLCESPSLLWPHCTLGLAWPGGQCCGLI